MSSRVGSRSVGRQEQFDKLEEVCNKNNLLQGTAYSIVKLHKLVVKMSLDRTVQ